MRRFSSGSLFFAGILLYAFALCGCKPDGSRADQSPVVLYRELQPRTIHYYKDLPGKVIGALVSEVRPQVTGLIGQKLFEEGTEVRAGDVLYSLDISPYQAAYDKALGEVQTARADLDAAKKQAERSAILDKSKAISRHEYETAQANLARIEARIKTAEGALKAAAIDLERANVRAPVSGRIGRSNVTPGMLVTANQVEPLAIIQQYDPIYVDIALPEKEWSDWKQAIELGKITTESPANPKVIILSGNSLPDAYETFEKYGISAQTSFLDMNVRADTGAMIIRASVPNADRQLLPGMWTLARVMQGVRENAILVPQRAVSHDKDGNAHVFVLEKVASNNKFRLVKRKIITDRVVKNGWLVDEGLNPGDLLAVDGFQNLSGDQNVLGVPDDSLLSDSEGAWS